VKDEVGEVVPPGTHAVQAAVEHMGHPRQRVKIMGLFRDKRPTDGFQIQACLHVWILGHIQGVIVIHKLVQKGLAVNGDARENEGGANARHNAPLRV